MAGYEPGSWVWLPDTEDCFVPAKVKQFFKAGEAGKVLTEDGEDRVLSAEETKDLQALHTEVLDSGIDNLINFNELHENALLHNLRIRFKQDKIYTYVSSILISVNPFKLLPIYTPEVLESYRSGGANKAPHVFAVADAAYNAMLAEKRHQSVVISGESGSGKSEATKLILQYLAETSSGGRGESAGLEQQILQSNPLMESFGNAKTVRNNNSSRFGKLITIYFDHSGSIGGGSVISYLLEKTRVVSQMKEERNYHIFYQLLAGAEAHPELKSLLHLDSASTFHYTSQSGVDRIDGVSDEKDFEEVRTAMDTLGMSSSEQLDVLRVVATVLHFGNVKFDMVTSSSGEDGSAIANPETLALASSLLQLDKDLMNRALTFRNVGTKSAVLVNYTIAQAAQARDAMTKALYSALFDWLMRRINTALGKGQDPNVPGRSIIGVLDIFGFESFETNSFEQLCINYCNEKLQFHFNEHIFRLEIDVYNAEGVNVPTTSFKDNKPTLLLLEDKAAGVFAMIDEEMNVPRGSDDTYLSKVKTKHAKHENFCVPKVAAKAGAGVGKDPNKCFGIKHYAGEVFYDVHGFIEKNKDTLSGDLINALQASAMPFMEELFPKPKPPAEDAGAAKGRGRGPMTKAAKVTLGAQFKTQLSTLMDTLNATYPHFVRCMKPNSLKRGSVFQSPMMLAQLRYAGLLEVCRIRKLGFPIRRDFDAFLKRYACIFPGVASIELLLAKLTETQKLTTGLWAKGSSKVFLKTEMAQSLEAQRELALTAVAVTVQKIARRYICRVRYASWRRTLLNLRAAVQARSLEQLDSCLDMLGELPHQGNHLADVKAARALKQRILEEQRVTLLLETACKARDLSGLRAAIAAADSMAPPLSHPVVAQGKALLSRLEEELQVRQSLQTAMQSRQREALGSALQKAKAMGLECDEVRQASALLARLDEEEALCASLRAAAAARDLSALKAQLARASELGLEGADVAGARAVLKSLEEEAQAKATLAHALTQRDVAFLKAALERASAAGLPTSSAEVQGAMQLLASLQKEAAVRAALVAATDARTLPGLQKALDDAKALHLTTGPEFANASSVHDQLLAEAKCRADLRTATEKCDAALLNAALGEAMRLGLSGAEVEAARQASASLGQQSALQAKLSALLGSEDLSALSSALAEAAAAGMGGCAQAVALTEQKRVLEHEAAVVRDLRAALQKADLEELSRAVNASLGCAVGTKYPADVSAAKEAVSRLTEMHKLRRDLSDASRHNDAEALRALLARATSVAGSPEFVQASAVLARLEKDAGLLGELRAAADQKQWEALASLLAKAETDGLPKEQLEPYRVLVERSRNLGRASDALVEATNARNLPALQQAISVAIALGLSGAAVDRAVSARDELIHLDQVLQDVRAAVTTLTAQGESERGISSSDVDPLTLAIETADRAGLSSDQVVSQARALRDRMLQQLAVQHLLSDALKIGDLAALRSAVDRAEDLDLKLEDLKSAKRRLRELTRGKSTVDDSVSNGHRGPEELKSPVSVAGEELERQRQVKREHARNPKFAFRNFGGLRSSDAFVKGVLLNKKKAKDGMLRWQAGVLRRSLLELDVEDCKLAVQLHKSLLGYMGEKTMAYPATLAQDILRKGHEQPILRDEIYLQILKQLSGNPKAESMAKGWQMLCMCVTTFPPSPAFQDYLMNYILEKEAVKGAISNYARYCLRTLEGMLSSGATGFVPSTEEILAYKERPPILATIELVDGTVISEELPVTPDLNVGKVVGICSHFLELHDSRKQHFGIFAYDLPGEVVYSVGKVEEATPPPYHDLERTPRPLGNNDFMGSVLVEKVRQRRNFKFVFKRKLFLTNSPTTSEDPMFKHLMYLQLEDETLLTGNLHFDKEDDAVTLAALSLLVNYGDEYETAGVMDFVPPRWRNQFPEEQWKAKVQARCKAPEFGGEVEELKQVFIDKVATHPLFGASFFHVHRQIDTPEKPGTVELVRKLPRDLTLAFNATGLHIFDSADMSVELHAFGFADIYKWGGSSTQFVMVLWDGQAQKQFELMVVTAQAPDMATIILDYIHAIMQAQKMGTL